MAVEDIIFGKNRHMFGGIEPSNMIKFEVSEPVVHSGGVKIDIQIPNDTIIDGQALCSVAGAMIRKRYDDYPKDEFDGELVCIVTDKNPTSIQDFPMGPGEEYKSCFYSAFPFTSQGVYNRGAINRTAVNVPVNLNSFKVYSEGNATKCNVVIIGSFVEDDYINTVSGVMIRRSTITYPVDETDGDFVTDISLGIQGASFTYTDADLEENVKYYYTAFPYNSYGVYNRKSSSKSECITRRYNWVYGYDLDTVDSNPRTRVTYPSDVDNTSYIPVSHTGTNTSPYTYKFSYGDWEKCGFMPKPCMLKYDGTVGEYLNPNDYGKTIEGDVSNVANPDYEGNAMMEWGKIWTKRWEDENGIYHFRCSDSQLDESYECWCNYDKDNNQIDNFYTAIYPTTSYTNNGVTRQRSISGRYISYTGGGALNLNTDINNIKNNGSGWYCDTLADILLIQDLLVLIGKSTDTSTVFSNPENVQYWAANSGRLDAHGLFSEMGICAKVFGMEYWWGYYGRYVPTWRTKAGVQSVKITPGTLDGSSLVGYDVTNTLDTGYIPFRSFAANGGVDNSGVTTYIPYHIKKMDVFSYGRLSYYENINTDRGSVSTYECDIAVASTTISDIASQIFTSCVGSNVIDSWDTTHVGYNAGAFSYSMSDGSRARIILGLSYRKNSTVH